MTTPSPAVTECIEAIDATLKSIEATLEESRRDHAKFVAEMAVLNTRYEAVRRGRAE